MAVNPTGKTANNINKKNSTLAQVNRQFEPSVLPVQKGTMVSFPNKDTIKHHVYSFSPAKMFELKLYDGSTAQPVVFDKIGVVAIGCNIHDWMRAYIYVVDTPLFCKTDENGKGTILDIPAGRYLAKVWHPRRPRGHQDGYTREIVFQEEDDKSKVSFMVSLKRVRRLKPPDFEGDSY